VAAPASSRPADGQPVQQGRAEKPLVYSRRRLVQNGKVDATGTFSGQVTGAAGAAVPDAQVKITDQETGTSITRKTGGDGYYTAPLLKSGFYTIEASASGFGTGVAWNLTLQIQQVAQ
jgi:Carboxypeptidase regulatory-like domain